MTSEEATADLTPTRPKKTSGTCFIALTCGIAIGAWLQREYSTFFEVECADTAGDMTGDQQP